MRLGLIAVLGLAGCWFRLGGATGSVELSWSFNGGRNCRSAGVTQLEIAGAGPTVFLPCIDIPGSALSTATLAAVPAGTQTFVLSGIGLVYDPDAGQAFTEAAYQGTFTFDISEASTNITAPVDLAPVDSSETAGDLLLLWTIERGDCEGAAVTEIQILTSGRVRLDGGGAIEPTGKVDVVPCHASGFSSGFDAGSETGLDAGFEGVRILGLGRGLYSAPLWGQGRNQTFAAAPTAYISGHTETVMHVDLHNTQEELVLPDELLLTLKFAVGDGGDCQSSGLQLIKLNLQRSGVNGVGRSIDGAPTAVNVELAPPQSQAVPCSSALGAGVQFHNYLLESLPCSGPGTAGASCPITAGEYHLSVLGLTAERTAYELGDYDLWIDQGLINGVTAGEVPEYDDFTNGNLVPNVTNYYVVPLPLIPQSQ